MTFAMSHILIVDDDDKIRGLLKEFLTENNFLISTAADATEALEKLNYISFDLIIIDIMTTSLSNIRVINKKAKIMYDALQKESFS